MTCEAVWLRGHVLPQRLVSWTRQQTQKLSKCQARGKEIATRCVGQRLGLRPNVSAPVAVLAVSCRPYLDAQVGRQQDLGHISPGAPSRQTCTPPDINIKTRSVNRRVRFGRTMPGSYDDTYTLHAVHVS